MRMRPTADRIRRYRIADLTMNSNI